MILAKQPRSAYDDLSIMTDGILNVRHLKHLREVGSRHQRQRMVVTENTNRIGYNPSGGSNCPFKLTRVP